MKFRFAFILASAALNYAPCHAGNSELRICLHAEPKTLNPVLVEDEPSETVRYLTGGVLIRINRVTQALEPELARSWELQNTGRTIRFHLRDGVRFSDGTPFTANDVAFTMRTLLAPNVHSATADSFRSGEGSIQTAVSGKADLSITFPSKIAGVERLFDQVAIISEHSPLKERAVLGPFVIAEHKPGSYLLLHRNSNYWKKDDSGHALPYLDYVRLEIQQNREMELLRFQRGQIDIIESLDPDHFERLAGQSSAVQDAGPTLESELIWFNQIARSPLPEYKKTWFRSRVFRHALSKSINREDLCRVVYHGRARPGIGPFLPANRIWFNSSLKANSYDPKAALQALAGEGFHRTGDRLADKDGHPVEFSVITNAGNRARERMAAMIQQDLRHIGVQLNIVTLDFPSLLERISKTLQYEACLLGMVNVDLDPNGQMNVWLSSGPQHQWNPAQAAPETAWEAEIDNLMRAQASSLDPEARKAYFDRVQKIVAEQEPFLYLVNRNALMAVSPALRNVKPSVLRPQVLWNVEWLSINQASRGM
jgi:peptide/nickel transport system substrate-binding protein